VQLCIDEDVIEKEFAEGKIGLTTYEVKMKEISREE